MSGPAKGAPPTWSVVCTTIEPPALIEVFAAHHLAVGAAQVIVFLDDPRDAALLAFVAGSPITLVPCDEAYWAERKGGRPTDHRHRQTWNAEFAARRLTRTDWIANIDADEMIHPRGDASIADLLARVPPEADVVRLAPAERMFVGHWDEAGLEVSGVFKLPRSGLGRRLYGREWGRIIPNGLQGHEQGKSFRRTARDNLRFRIHRVFDGTQEVPPVQVPSDAAVLLHLFPASFADWRSKYLRRLRSPAVLAGLRPRQRARFEAFGAVADAEGPDGIRALFDRLCVLPGTTADRLVAEGLAFGATLPTRLEARQALSRHRLPEPFEPLRKGLGAGRAVWLVGAEPGDGPDLCRLLAAHGYGHAYRDLRRGGAAARPPDGFPGVDVTGGLDLDADLIALIDEESPDVVLVLNRRPLSRWIAEHVGSPGRPVPPAAAGSLERSWERRLADLRRLEAAGRRVLDWAVEVEKPSDLIRALERLWDPGDGEGTGRPARPLGSGG